MPEAMNQNQQGDFGSVNRTQLAEAAMLTGMVAKVAADPDYLARSADGIPVFEQIGNFVASYPAPSAVLIGSVAVMLASDSGAFAWARAKVGL